MLAQGCRGARYMRRFQEEFWVRLVFKIPPNVGKIVAAQYIADLLGSPGSIGRSHQ